MTREELRRKLRHDLRSPLAVILGRAELLLEGVYGELNADQRRSLEVVARNAERLTRELEAVAEAFDEGTDPSP
ncbi:MAG: hypothetical protein H6738_07095 [Alphaproteobacteria bacterium]|nr:hypothetical protein [Alphaproteobacteria bacterium]MCB9696528.1 hypothetical protein [Alphaproteobacteria bacterium]